MDQSATSPNRMYAEGEDETVPIPEVLRVNRPIPNRSGPHELAVPSRNNSQSPMSQRQFSHGGRENMAEQEKLQAYNE